MNYKVIYYTSERGDNPVEEFINVLDATTRAKFFSYVNLLSVEGPNLKRPYADVVRGKIRELRPRQARILYFFAIENKIVLLHGFRKKTQEINPKDISLAEKRTNEWLLRRGGHL